MTDTTGVTDTTDTTDATDATDVTHAGARSPAGRLVGKVAVVTGAGRGIGRGLALALAREGAAVGLGARTGAEIDAVAREIVAAGGRAVAVPCDVRDRAAVECLVETTAATFGRLDIAIANAGGMHGFGPVSDVEPDDWWATHEVNVLGTLLTCRAAIPHLRSSGGGHILVMGSGARLRGGPGWSAYSSSKAAVFSLVRILAQELRSDAISVNEIIPGPVQTELADFAGATVALAPGAPGVFGGEWLKQPADVAEFVLGVLALPSRGPTAQSFSLLGRDA